MGLKIKVFNSRPLFVDEPSRSKPEAQVRDEKRTKENQTVQLKKTKQKKTPHLLETEIVA